MLNLPSDQFFIFRDGSPVTGDNAREVLKSCLSRLGLDPMMYGMHSFRVESRKNYINIDLIKYNYSIEEV